MLTVKFLDSKLNKPQEKEVVKAHRYGLSARIRKTGSITFVFRYKWLGKEEKIAIGSYPELGITEASEIAKKYQAMIAEDKNPKRERIVDRTKQTTEYTVKRMLLEWWEDFFKDHPDYAVRNKYPYDVKRGFEIHIFPKLGSTPWDLVDRRQWSSLFQDMKRRVPAITQRMVTAVKSAAGWAVGNGLTKEHPLMEFTAKRTLGISNKRGERTLSDEELYLVFNAIEESRIKPGNKILFKLLIIYGCRTIELRLLQPHHLDFKNGVWTVPREIAKPKDAKRPDLNREIKRPLFAETIELFNQAIKLKPKSKYLFPKENGEPMGETALLDISMRLTHKINKTHPEANVKHWTKHDLRRTMRTNMSKLTEPHIAEKMIGHALTGEFETYDKYDYLQEQLIGYQKWYQRLDNIWNQRDNVTVIGKRKGA